MSLQKRLGLIGEPVYLIDGTAFVYRGFFANPNMQRSDGFPTGALYIVARLLLRIIREEQPSRCIFLLDGHGPNFRHELFPLYKAQRRATPEPLIQQLDAIQRLIPVLGIRLEISDQCEADDCIAALARRLRESHPVVIVGADKDFKQCLHPNVLLWDPASREEKLLTLESFREETGLQPEQWPDVQALIGDSSDNIPGIPGVGPKTAQKIFQDFSSLEDIRDRFAELPKKMQEKFAPHLESIFLYRQLTRLDTGACPHITLDDLCRTSVDRAAALAFFREFEFNSLARELDALVRSGNVELQKEGRGAESESLDLSDPFPPEKTRQASLFDNQTAASPRLQSCDSIEQLAPCADKVVALVPQGAHFLLATESELLYTASVDELAAFLAAARQIIAPDVKALLRSHPAWEAIPVQNWFDLGLASYLLDPEERDYSWHKIAAHWAEEVEISPENPALLARAVAERLQKRLDTAELTNLMKTLEIPLLPVLASMERYGIGIDRNAFALFLDEIQQKIDALTEDVYTAAGMHFNIRSAQQLGEVLFSVLQLPTAGKTRGGQASTSQDALEKIAGKHPVVDSILEFRKLEKLRSTYLEPLPRLADAEGRIHTSFNQLATATGRLSSSAPNLQNIPVRGALGARMRSCFTAPTGMMLVSADYSQIELRVLAHLSQEATLLDSFAQGEDIHARTAGLLFDCAPDAVTPEQRRNAKTINFGLIYGMGAQKLAQDLKIPLAEAKEFIERYFSRLTGLRTFYEGVEAQAKEQAFVTTLAGRRRLLPEILSDSPQLQSQARRQAINTLIQGSAADIIKIAMIRAYNSPDLRGLNARLILQVHDELLLEVPEDTAQEAGACLAALMENIHPNNTPLAVPLLVDWGVAQNGGLAH